MRSYLYIIACVLCFVGCRPQPTEQTQLPAGNSYAQGFQISHTEDGVVIEVFEPYQRVLVQAPMQRLATMSAVQVGFMDALDGLDALVALCNPELVYTPLRGTEMNIGDALQPNAERVLQAKPDLLLAVHYGQADNKEVERLEDLGVRVLYINEWQETHPLARAEWIRVIGALLGKTQQADSLFAQIESDYKQLCAEQKEWMDQRPHHRQTIMTGGNFRGTWYVPGAESYLAQLFRDAQADYPYYHQTGGTSIPLTIEQVLHDFNEADIWIGASAHTLQQLQEIDPKHIWFKAYEQERVYNWYKQQNGSGANNFWERGVVYPNEILLDLITILRHDTTAELHYAERLY